LLVRPKKIRNHNIEKLVSSREVWFLEWDWVKQFPVSYPKTGPYVYVNKSLFPDEDSFDRFDKERGTLFLPKDSILEERLIQKFE